MVDYKNDCKFKGFNFNNKVKLKGGKSVCNNCGFNIQAVVESITWIYQGHSGGMDLCTPASNIFCPSCGDSKDCYLQHCEEGGTGLDVSFLLQIPILNKREE